LAGLTALKWLYLFNLRSLDESLRPLEPLRSLVSLTVSKVFFPIEELAWVCATFPKSIHRIEPYHDMVNKSVPFVCKKCGIESIVLTTGKADVSSASSVTPRGCHGMLNGSTTPWPRFPGGASMRPRRSIASVRGLLAIVAAVALVCWFWVAYVDPVRSWQRAINDESDGRIRQLAIRRAIADMVPGLGADDAVRILSDALRSSANPQVRDYAAMGLASFGAGARNAVSCLMLATRDPDSLVRASAAEALGRVLARPDPRVADATSALTAALNDRFSCVRFSAAESLVRLGEYRDRHGKALGLL